MDSSLQQSVLASHPEDTSMSEPQATKQCADSESGINTNRDSGALSDPTTDVFHDCLCTLPGETGSTISKMSLTAPELASSASSSQACNRSGDDTDNSQDISNVVENGSVLSGHKETDDPPTRRATETGSENPEAPKSKVVQGPSTNNTEGDSGAVCDVTADLFHERLRAIAEGAVSDDSLAESEGDPTEGTFRGKQRAGSDGINIWDDPVLSEDDNCNDPCLESGDSDSQTGSKRTKSCSEETESPRKNTGSPTKNTESPSKKMESSSKKAERKSAKKAREELQEIYSTSMRMKRESSVSLPYHEPDKLSLKEFLNRNRAPATPVPGSQLKTEPEHTDVLLCVDTPCPAPTDASILPQVGEQDTKADAEVIELKAADASIAKTSTESTKSISGSRRERLLAIAGDLTPRLSSEPVIVLEGDGLPRGVELLLDRVVHHSKMDSKKNEKMPIAIAATPDSLESSIREAGPGQQLLALREQLLRKVREQRQRSRAERQRQQCLDNEEFPPGHPDADPTSNSLPEFEEEEEEEILSDAESSVSESDQDGGSSSDEDIVLSRKRSIKRHNPVLEDDDDSEEETPAEAANKEDCGWEGQHLEMPAFDPDDDDDDQEVPPEIDSQFGDDFMRTPEKGTMPTRNASLDRSGSTMKSFQSDESNIFTPLTGLPTSKLKLSAQNTSQEALTLAADSMMQTPPPCTIKEAPSLPLTPLQGIDSTPTRQSPFDKAFAERLSRTWSKSTPRVLAASQDMDELVELCSGNFAAGAKASDADSDADIASDAGSNLDPAPFDTLADEVGTDYDESDHTEAVDDEADEERPVNSLRDFFEDEAELSGSDKGSDGEDEDEDEEEALADLIAPDDGNEDSRKIHEEIGRFHFKQLLDEDKRELKIYQELLFEDGDLHTDGNGRQRQFRWRNSATFEATDGMENSDGEGGDPGGEDNVDAAWRLQRLERQRWLQEQVDKEETFPSSESFPERESSSHVPLGFRNKDAKFGQKEGATKTGVCGSFLKFNPGVLGRIAERIKVAAPADKEGSLTTKNFVFRTEEKPKKRAANAVPPQYPAVKKLKVEVPKQRVDRKSIFNVL